MRDLDSGTGWNLESLCREIGEACVTRLARIVEASDPSDRSLQSLLRTMAEEARLQAKQVRVLEKPAALHGLSERSTTRDLIRAALPSLSKGFGEGVLHRDAALFYAESLEEEAARFYRSLAEHTREWEARSLLMELSERERGKLHFLREVVLQG